MGILSLASSGQMAMSLNSSAIYLGIAGGGAFGGYLSIISALLACRFSRPR
jgi:predicted MFS family arabinose efflux permease